MDISREITYPIISSNFSKAFLYEHNYSTQLIASPLIEGLIMKYRAFISVHIEPDDRLLDLHIDLASGKSSLKMVAPDKLHITLKFLGDTDVSLNERIIEIMEDIVNDKTPFEIELRGAGAFPSDKYIKVVWVGVDSKGRLEAISERLNSELKSLGFKSEKGFRGHLTLARVKNARDKKKISRFIKANRDTIIMNFEVKNIELMKSTLTPTGPIYEIVRSITLASGDEVIDNE